MIFSDMNSIPISFAKKDMTSTLYYLIRQLLSLANSDKAGVIDAYNESIPKILAIWSSFLNKAMRTSEFSSFNKVKKIGKMTSYVFFLPIYGHKHKNEVASYTLTKYWESFDKHLILGTIFELISVQSKN